MSWSRTVATIGMLFALCPAGFANTDTQDKALEEIRKELAELRKQNQDLQRRLGGIETSPLRSSESLESEILQLNARLAAREDKGEKKEMFKMSGQLRERIEWRNQTNKVDDFRILSRFTLGMDWTISEDLKVFAQLRDSRRFGDAVQSEFTGGNGAGTEATDDGAPEMYQVYAWMKNVMGTGMNLKFGRQEISFGKKRIISDGDWSNLGRSFEAIRADGSLGDLTYTVFLAELFAPTTGTNDDRLWGLYTTMPIAGDQLSMDFYGFYQANDALGADAHMLTIGTRAWGKMDMLDYEGELASQQNSPHDAASDVDFNDAYMIAANVGIDLASMADCKPKLTLKYDCGSPQWTELFPTNHARYGQSDFVTTATNHVHWAAILSGTVMDSWTLSLEGHWNRAFAQSGSDKVNHEIDISLTGKCSEHMMVGIWAGHVFNDKNGSATFGAAGPWITPTAGDHSNDADFVTVQFSIPF